MRISPKFTLLLACIFALTAFAAETDTNMAASKPDKAADTTDKSNEVVVTVNGVNITEGQIESLIQEQMTRMPGQLTPDVVTHIRASVLDRMIIEQVVKDAVKKAGIPVSDSDVDAKISEITGRQNIPIESFKALLKAQGQSFEQFREQMKLGLAFEKLIEQQAGAVDINDADALAFYNENKADYNTPEQVRASHILISVSPSASEEEKAKAKEKIEGLLKQVKEGADFAKLAMENSDCPSKAKGGDLSLFGRGQMVKPFEDAAFAMKPGEVSGVVETQFGYHIIKVTDRKPAGMTPFEEAKPQIIEMLKQMKMRQITRGYLDKLKAEAKIEYPAGKNPNEAVISRPLEKTPATD